MEFPFIRSDYPPPKNLFLDMEQPDGRPALISTPGLELYCDFGSSSEIRGMHYVKALDCLIVVCGANVYKVYGKQAYELLDTLSTSTGRVWMEDNGIELLISDGATGYIYNFTRTFTGLARCAYGESSGMIDNTDQVWTWGDNTYGQIGDNTKAGRSSPVQVVGSHSFTEITIGDTHIVGIKSNGEVWTWGQNDYGQVGDNTATDRSSPVEVVGSHSFTKIGAGEEHSVALKADGSVWSWGRNAFGSLGDNTTTSKSSPVAVVGSHSFVEIRAGAGHSVARKADGTAWTWGLNNVGQLGDNTNLNRSSPVAVVGSHSFVKISGESAHSAALKADGSAWTWGYNNYGQLGDNTITDKSSPVAVVGSHSFVEIQSGQYHSVALKADGSVWTWGRNNEGQLGDNTTTDKSSPVVIIRKFQPLSSIGPTTMGTLTFIDGYMATNDVGTQRWYISASYEAANWPELDYTSAEEWTDDLVAVIMNQGELWALGDRSIEVYQNTGATDFPFVRIPGAFLDVGCNAAASVAQKDNSIFFLDNDNRVRRAGGPIGYSSAVISTPAMDEELSGYGDTSNAEGITYSQCGHDFYQLTFPSIPKTWVYDITTTAHAQTHIWHQRESGSLGRWLARCHVEFDGKDIFGAYNSGKLYAAKDGHFNDHGLAIARRYLGPVIRKNRERIFFHAFEVEIQAIQGIFSDFACGASETIGLKANGLAWAWGNNTHGQLGDNTVTTRSSPVLIVGSHSFIKMVVGYDCVAGLKNNGEVWTWGYNNYGQLGDNNTISRSSPVAVVGSHSFIDISCCYYDILALKSNGEVWGWGRNQAGSLGDNSTTSRSSPVVVIGSHNFVEIKNGYAFSIGRKADGSVWAWGDAGYGQLGDNSITDKSSPVAVVGAHSFMQISTAFYNGFGLKSDGNVWAWGYNDLGQLGDNTTTSRSSPVIIVGSHVFVEVANGGQKHNLARKSNGEVWAWGDNTDGRLGDNTVTGRSSPVQIVGNISFSQIATGYYHSVARKSNGQIWCWGLNSSGQLGDNTTTSRSSPVQIVSSYGAQAVLDWKDENDQWSSEYNLDIPSEDNDFVRTRLNRCGQARSRQYRVTVTDPVPVIIKSAYTDMGDEESE